MNERLSIVATLLDGPVETPEELQDESAQQEAFATLKSLVDAQTGVNAAQTDWAQVETLSTDYLRQVACDLRVACFLARAWAHLHGAEGAVDGAHLLRDMIKRKADELAPPRVRGRQQALQWWASQTRLLASTTLAAGVDDTHRDALLEILDELSVLLAGDTAIAGKKELFDELRAALKQDAAAAPAPASASAAAEAEPAAGAKATSGAATGDKPRQEDATLAGWIAEISSPISASAPAGDDGHLSDEFEHLQQQVNDTWRVKEVDWQALFDEGRAYLRSQSKDLRVMAYSCFAALQCDGVRGLSRGLAMLDVFLREFAVECFPQRAKGRSAALRWLARMTEGGIKRDLLANTSVDQLQICMERAEAVNEQLTTRDEVQVDIAALAKLARTLREEIDSRDVAPEPAPKTGKTAAPVESDRPRATRSTTVSAPAASEKLDSDDGFRSAVRDGKSFILSLARFKRQSDPKNPIAYKLLRNWLWGTLGTTVRPDNLPAPAKKPELEDLLVAGDPATLLDTAETRLVSSPFWLDPNRYTVLALEQLDAGASAAAVRSELRDFLQRYPQLTELSFRGDVPLANPATQSWIASEVLVEGQGTIAPAAAQSDEDVVAGLAAARELASDGKQADAIETLDAKVRSADNDRARFQWQLAMARFLLELKAADMALAYIDVLETAISRHDLERWEPALSMDVAWLAQQVERGLGAKSSGKQRAADLADAGRARICRLAPAVALERFAKAR